MPNSSSVTIQLLDNYIGKEVGLIAVNKKKESNSGHLYSKIEKIKKKYSAYPRVDLCNFSLERDEANDFS